MSSLQPSNRRTFLNHLAKAVGVLGVASFSSSPPAHARRLPDQGVETWFDKLKGKHKIVFDAISANEGYQVVWAHTFMDTNNQVGTPDAELGVMVVLRNKAIALAMNDKLWATYKLGKFFKITDRATNAPAERNLYWNPLEGEMPEAGMSIKSLMARGVMFCVCETAIGVNSHQVAKSRGMDPAALKKEWLEGLLPGIQPVPSGVLAVNRAQERGASYCYAG